MKYKDLIGKEITVVTYFRGKEFDRYTGVLKDACGEILVFSGRMMNKPFRKYSHILLDNKKYFEVK